MASFKSKAISFLIRKQHLFRSKLRKERFDENTSIEAFRDRCERGAAKYAKMPVGVTIKPEVIENMNAEWHIPEGANPQKLILYVHGGGYVSGSVNDHRGFVSKFAKRTGVTCLLYEYRLAPEHHYPAALEDSVRMYQWLLNRACSPENMIIAGESAGGGLCLAMLLAIRDRNIPLPAAALAISPWTDLTCSSDSYKTKNHLSPAPLDSWHVFSKHYCGPHPANLPYISPLFGDLHGLPPIFINAGENDELFEDGEKFFLKTKAAGVDVKFRAGKGMLHCYPLLDPMFPEATKAMDEIVEWVRARLKI